jgi:amino acid transporter
LSEQTKLIRAVGRWDLVALAINGLIGSAIFGLPAGVAQLTGAWSPLACLFCGVVILLVVLCFAEASSLFVGTGGPYLYARTAFGDLIGLAGGWMMWLARVTAFAANVNLLVSFLGYLLPWIREAAPRAVLLAAIVSTLTWINIRGVKQGAAVGDFLAAAKLIPMFAFVGIGLFAIKPQLYTGGAIPGRAEFGQAVLLYLFAFTGFEYAVIPAGEALAPRKHLPMAILTASLVACVLYTGIQIVCVGTLPGLAQSQTAMADAAARFLGSAGGQIIALTAVISILGNLSGMALISPRLTYALAEDGLLPVPLRAVHSRYHTPYVSILLYGVVTLGMALSGTFVGMVRVSAVARIVPYALTCLAVPVLRKKFSGDPDHFRLRGGMLIPALAVLICLWLLWQSQWKDALAAACALAAGVLFYAGNLIWLRWFNSGARPAKF